VVSIPEDHIYLLPPCIPHSPQRPNADSLGLVVERQRQHEELDCLRFYKDFESCDDVLWERYFKCNDLGRDLVPVVQEFLSSTECSSGKPGDNVVRSPPFEQNTDVEVPPPVHLPTVVARMRAEFHAGGTVPLFVGHPDTEFSVFLHSKGSFCGSGGPGEAMVMQIDGTSEIAECGAVLAPGHIVVVPEKVRWKLNSTSQTSVSLIVTQFPNNA